MICFFDDIVTQPQQLIKEVFTFLNVDSTIPIPVNKLNVKVNASRDKPIPDTVKRYLAKKYYPEIKKLIPLVGGYSEVWLRDIEANL